MIKEIFIKYFKKELPQIVTRLLTAWITVSLFFMITSQEDFTSLDFFVGSNFAVFILCTASLFLSLFFISKEKLITMLMIGSAFIYCVFAAAKCSDFYFLLGCCALISGMVYYSKMSDIHFTLSKTALWIGVGAIILLFTVFVGITCSLKYKNHWTPCYDFGIFSQMFYYMKETGQALVTCERDGLLSHFAVHFSPIFYLLLPFYCLFPSPTTLLIGQCAVVAAGVVPLVKICRYHKLSNLSSLAFAVCYILYPTFTGGCLFYIHENNFLAPLLLFLIYFLERKKTIVVFIFALLTLLVKEDAAVYVAVIALYFIFADKNYKCNFSLLAFSIIYFICVTGMLSAYGDGVMSWHYNNYIYDEGGVFTVIKAAVQNPLYVMYQSVTENKIMYILQMLVPLLFMPFCSKKASRLILLIPFLLVNIMTNYVYQYDINYQYGFGSGALLIYLSVINYADMGDKRKKLLLCSVLSSVIIFIGTYGGKLNYYEYYGKNAAQREAIDYAVGLVPNDASVSCSTFILPNMSSRKELYQLESTEQITEYYVVDLRLDKGRERVEDFYTEDFEILFLKENVVGVFKRH